MEHKIYNLKGAEAGTISLPESVFGLKWNADLVHQVIVSMESNKRIAIAHTKGRGDVSGGGKKPWRQKGTGRARHGSSRSPIWKGGGITHGPTSEKNYDRKVNKKMKAKALYTLLSAKLKKGELLFVDSLSLSTIKTKDAALAIKNLAKVDGFKELATKKRNAAQFTVFTPTLNEEKSFANIGAIALSDIHNLNPLDLVKYKYLVIANPKESIDFLSGKIAVKTK